MLFRDSQGGRLGYMFQKIWLKNLLGFFVQEQVVRQNPPWIGDLRPSDVASGQAQPSIRSWQQSRRRLDQNPAHPSRNGMIQRKLLVQGVARVSAEQFISAITRQQSVHSILVSEKSA